MAIVVLLGFGTLLGATATAVLPPKRWIGWACAGVLVLVLGAALALAWLGRPGFSTAGAITVLALALAAVGGSPVVKAVYELAFRGPHADPRVPSEQVSGLPASAAIGVVERFSFTLALLLGLSDVAAVIFGVKALGQYSASTKHDAAKRVIGTLVSIAWATACFAVTRI